MANCSKCGKVTMYGCFDSKCPVARSCDGGAVTPTIIIQNNGMSYDDFCKLIGADKHHATAKTIYDALDYNGFKIVNK